MVFFPGPLLTPSPQGLGLHGFVGGQEKRKGHFLVMFCVLLTTLLIQLYFPGLDPFHHSLLVCVLNPGSLSLVGIELWPGCEAKLVSGFQLIWLLVLDSLTTAEFCVQLCSLSPSSP